MQLYEKSKTKYDNFAYINVNLKDFTPVERTEGQVRSWDYELLIHESQVIGCNRVLGKFQAVMNFKVVNRVVPEQEDFPVNQAMADIAQTFGDVGQ